LIQDSWVLGYFSAHNEMAGGRGLFLRFDEKGLLDWITQYCAIHPKTRIVDAAAGLAKGLAWSQLGKPM